MKKILFFIFFILLLITACKAPGYHLEINNYTISEFNEFNRPIYDKNDQIVVSGCTDMYRYNTKYIAAKVCAYNPIDKVIIKTNWILLNCESGNVENFETSDELNSVIQKINNSNQNNKFSDWNYIN